MAVTGEPPHGAELLRGRPDVRGGIVLGVLLATAVAALTLVLARGIHTARAFLEPFKHAIPAAARAAALRAVPDLRDVELHTSDGLTLRGWFWPGTRHAVVILVHGDGGDRTQLFPTAVLLARHGYGFLAFDSRAHGESEGDRVTWGDSERKDVGAALDFALSTPNVDSRRVALLGFSIGGTTSTLVAAGDTRVQAAIVSPVWTSLEDEVASKSGRLGFLSRFVTLHGLRAAGVDVDAVRPVDRVAQIAPRPVFFITGTTDTDTPVPVMERMFAAAHEPKRLWVVPGASHGGYLQTAPSEYETRVIAFLDEALGMPTPPPL